MPGPSPQCVAAAKLAKSLALTPCFLSIRDALTRKINYADQYMGGEYRASICTIEVLSSLPYVFGIFVTSQQISVASRELLSLFYGVRVLVRTSSSGHFFRS